MGRTKIKTNSWGVDDPRFEQSGISLFHAQTHGSGGNTGREKKKRFPSICRFFPPGKSFDRLKVSKQNAFSCSLSWYNISWQCCWDVHVIMFQLQKFLLKLLSWAETGWNRLSAERSFSSLDLNDALSSAWEQQPITMDEKQRSSRKHY